MFKHIPRRRFSFLYNNNSLIRKDPVLQSLGLKNLNLLRNLSTAEIYEFGLSLLEPADPETRKSLISSTGAMCSYSGNRTGRSPKDRRVVQDDKTYKDVWWGDVNIPIKPHEYGLMEGLTIDYLNNRKRIYVTDAYLGWDPKYRLKVRVLTTRAYHALFMGNMLIMPTDEELKRDFSNGVDFHVFNSGEMLAPNIPNIVNNQCCVATDLTNRKMIILGTQYAGEMKKGLFSVMNYMMPKQGVLSLHASANEGVQGDTTLLFGLSGTGKTTLSADPKRRLIGDDEHCWSRDGIFNIEGGCYAKCINLSEEKEPEIYRALKFGAVLENVLFFDEHTREVNFADMAITENTRASYPLDYIPNAKIPAVGNHPKNLIFLTCDAFGVLPPVSKLTPEQAMYHFISGYTAKVAGTEVGIKEPMPTFSACFGAAFLPLHPTVYAEMLADKIKKHQTNAWLINTGWSGGQYGVGQRMSLKVTRKILDAIHEGKLDNVPTIKSKNFGLNIPEAVPGVDGRILDPENMWQEKGTYHETLNKLASSFIENFKTFEGKASNQIKKAGPKLETI